MPLLKFQCPACREIYEAFHRLNALKVGGSPCPYCGETQTKPVEAPPEQAGNEAPTVSQVE
jgi:hypothetical protein